MTLYGYAGTILRIDLSQSQIQMEPLPAAMAEKYLGGRGFVAKILFDEIQPGVDPDSADNIFIAAVGPLTGHFLPASGKTHFGAKSPATGGYADSNMGGHFGSTLKYAGYDVLVLTGKAAEPSYLVIDDDQVEIRPAQKYWGKGSLTCERMLKDDLGEDFEIITIGPGGERKVRFACISHDFGRQAGRTGIGLVLGAKNIKAIAVRGTGSLSVFDVEAAYAKGKDAYQKVREKPGFEGWTPEGTAGLTNWANEVGVFPTRNFQTSYAEHYKKINGKAILDRLKITDKACRLCPIPCGKYGHARTSLGEAHVEGPEYESIALFGGNCVLQSIEEVAYANWVCDELGIDTISAGVVAAWAIECYDRGILSEDQIGRKIEFGDLESLVFLLEKMALREKVGDLLAEGVKIASAKVGHDSSDFAVHVKGLEWTGYECRNAPAMMLAYLTSDIGAHHGRAWVLGYDIAGSFTSVHDLIEAGGSEEKQPKGLVTEQCAEYVIHSQHERPIFDALGTCRLQLMELGFEGEHYAELYQYITGNKLSWEELLGVSERIWHLTRAFNVREIEGFGRHWDHPPKRLCQDPIQSGPNEGHFIPMSDIEFLLDSYYKARGWDANGAPTRETLEKFGLKEIADAMQMAK